MAFQKDPPRKKARPLGPVFGLIVLVGVGTLSYFAAPGIVEWMANTELTAGAFNWKLLPFTFPGAWPDIAAELVVAFIMFLIIFTILMFFLFLFMRPPRSDADVELKKLRAEKEKMKKRR